MMFYASDLRASSGKWRSLKHQAAMPILILYCTAVDIRYIATVVLATNSMGFCTFYYTLHPMVRTEQLQ